MPPKKLDLTGEKIGKLQVIKMAGTKNYHSICECLCECGNKILIRASSLTSNNTKSCGCLQINITIERSLKHGMAPRSEKKSEYNIWCSMNARCSNPNSIGYMNYGGRGVSVCERWKNNFSAFYEDMGPRPSTNHSIDRMNVDGNYEPSNCKWGTLEQQARNKRVPRNNKSGIRGVEQDKRNGKWIVKIGVNGKQMYLGRFSEKEDAIKARSEAEEKYWAT